MTLLPHPELDWLPDGGLCARRFGDVYFTPGQGLAESRHVFLDGTGAPEAWRGRALLTIGETGFGTGRNFLLAWNQWRRTAGADARFCYLAAEGAPLHPADLARAHAAFPELRAEAAALRAAWPPPAAGFHRLRLDGGRVALTLLFGDATVMLSRMEARVDAWFLDGFAPARNPDIWQAGVFRQLARLSAPGARLASYTAAGPVRRGLEAAGFQVSKAPGFAAKREMIRAVYTGGPVQDPKPWLRPPPALARFPRRVAVVGGGVAGMTAAAALSAAGAEVTLYERQPPGAAVSPAPPLALVHPPLALGDGPREHFDRAAWLFACGWYAPGDWAGPRGVAKLARTAAESARFARIAAAPPLPGQDMSPLPVADAAGLAAITPPRNGFWLPRAGFLDPALLFPRLAADVDVRRGSAVTRLVPADDGWRLDGPDGPLGIAGAVILAGGCAALPQMPPSALPAVRLRRGELFRLGDGPAVCLPVHGLAAGAQLSPLLPGGGRIAGASQAAWRGDMAADAWRAPDRRHRTQVLDALAALSPGWGRLPLSPLWTGLRAVAADRMPVMGGLPDAGFFTRWYADLHYGRHPARYPAARYWPGLYSLTALGFHGFRAAPLLAACLADMILGAPLPLERPVLDALNPARMLLRGFARRADGALPDPDAD